jgi:hypothetical protein
MTLSIAGAISQITTQLDPQQMERLIVAMERLADCGCPPTNQQIGRGGGDCYQAKGADGSPLFFDGEWVFYDPEGYYLPNEAVGRVTFSGREPLTVTVKKHYDVEMGGDLILLYQDGRGGSQSVTIPTNDNTDYVQSFTPPDGVSWSVTIRAVEGVDGVVVDSITVCPTPMPATPSLIIPAGVLRGVTGKTKGEKPPLVGRPFFGPNGWQPYPKVTFVDVAEAVAFGTQSWAEKWADILTPSVTSTWTIRLIGEDGVLKSTGIRPNMTLTNLISAPFTIPLLDSLEEFSGRVELSVFSASQELTDAFNELTIALSFQ